MSDSDELLADDIIQIAPHFRLQWEKAQNAYVMLYPEGMVRLSESAAEILRRCGAGNTLRRIIAELRMLYGDGDVANDVREFLEEAAANGWIRIRRVD